MKLGEPKDKDIMPNFGIPSGLSSYHMIDVYNNIRDNVMLIRTEIFNYLER